MLAHQHPLRFTRAQIGTLADLTPSGGSFLAYLGSLKAGGLVDESGGDLGITPQGFAYLGVPPRSRPMGGAELVAYWRAALPSDTQRRMLDALVAAYPQGLDVGALADAVGMSGTGGAFNGHVGLLRRNGLAEKVGTRLRAGAMLFGARG